MNEQEHPLSWSTIGVVALLLGAAVSGTWVVAQDAAPSSMLAQRVTDMERRVTTVESWMAGANDKLGTINTNIALIQQKLAYIADRQHADATP